MDPKLLDLTLGVKIPVTPGSKPVFSRGKLGEKLHRPSCSFDLGDPYGRRMSNEYNSLHDPHLQAYHQRKDNLERLKRQGLVTSDGNVVCSLKEFNQYRQYRTMLKLEAKQASIREQEKLQERLPKLEHAPKLPGAINTSRPGPRVLQPQKPSGPGPRVLQPQTPSGPGPRVLQPQTPSGSGPRVLQPQTPSGPGPRVLQPQTPSGPGPRVLQPQTPSGPGPRVLQPQTPSGPGPRVLQPQTPSGPGPRVLQPQTPSGPGPRVLQPQTPSGPGPRVLQPQTPSGPGPRVLQPQTPSGPGLGVLQPQKPSGPPPPKGGNNAMKWGRRLRVNDALGKGQTHAQSEPEHEGAAGALTAAEPPETSLLRCRQQIEQVAKGLMATVLENWEKHTASGSSEASEPGPAAEETIQADKSEEEKSGQAEPAACNRAPSGASLEHLARIVIDCVCCTLEAFVTCQCERGDLCKYSGILELLREELSKNSGSRPRRPAEGQPWMKAKDSQGHLKSRAWSPGKERGRPRNEMEGRAVPPRMPSPAPAHGFAGGGKPVGGEPQQPRQQRGR